MFSSSLRSALFYPAVAHALSHGGPALQKWGQWSATRPDMFPLELCDLLRDLHTAVPSHSWPQTKYICETAIGRPLFEFFSDFSQRPLASGSIAQVHEAVLRDTGERVAVKVRHPHVMEMLWIDTQLMHGLTWALEAFVPALRFLHLQTSVAQFSHALAGQARLDIEAQNLVEMQRNFGSWRWRDVRIPQPLFAAPAVIVETLEVGQSIGKVKDKLSRCVAQWVVHRGQDVYLKMLLVDRFMHADLHPGNLFVDTTKIHDTGAELVLVDLGLVARLSVDEQMNFLGLVRALGYGDGTSAAWFLLRFCKPGSQRCKGACAEAFTRDVVTLFSKVCRGFGTGTDFGQVVRAVLELVRVHEVTISANYATLVVNALCLDGLAADLAPEYNLLDGCAPLLRLSALGQNPAGAYVLRKLYPLVSAFKTAADTRLRKR
eukprot:CAMPEP_0172865494 /NCGR_PEP_ID=MMETSP1075-20121228/81435_1 /TAXON_ID=2916 /ORGANISM="Ceratium fusus, Strain PA161109" /LENGTH=431 /DNA_ID=CAMNT_0013714529 /DNA_START=314 /DNA_END=1605 /DNA_ORIENTATION=+